MAVIVGMPPARPELREIEPWRKRIPLPKQPPAPTTDPNDIPWYALVLFAIPIGIIVVPLIWIFVGGLSVGVAASGISPALAFFLTIILFVALGNKK